MAKHRERLTTMLMHVAYSDGLAYSRTFRRLEFWLPLQVQW